MGDNIKKMNGRPSKFTDLNLSKIEMLVKKHFTNKEIAQFLDINEDTFYEWKNRHPSFSEALKDWKDEADSDIEHALCDRAKGYVCNDERTIFTQDGPQTFTGKKYYPPDPTSMIFWLKNRHPDRWTDRKVVEQTNIDGGTISVIVKDDEQRQLLEDL